MKIKYFLPMLLTVSFLFSCADQKKEENPITEVSTEFNYEVEQFADVKILRYQIPGFESLTLKQKNWCIIYRKPVWKDAILFTTKIIAII